MTSADPAVAEAAPADFDAQSRLRAIFEQTAVGIAETDLDGRFVLVNDRYCEIVGRSREELLGGLSMQAITDPADLPHNIEQFTRLIEDGTGFTIEKRYIRPDQERVWVRNTVSRIDDPGAVPRYVLAVCEDMTDRKRAEDALRDSEARYRRIFDAAGVSIWEEDLSDARRLLEQLREEGVDDLRAYLNEHPDVLRKLVRSVRVLDVNEQTLRLFGARNKDELVRSLETVFVAETLPAFVDELVAIFEGRPIVTSHARLQTVAGDRRDVVFTMRIPSGDSGFDSVPVALMDITEQRRAEADAERVRTDLARMLTQAPVPIAVISGPDLVFELANPAYREVTGGRDLVGRRVLDALPEVRGQGFDDFLREVMATGRPVVGQESLLRLMRDGELQDTYWTFIYAPLTNDANVVDRVMAICNEVTPQVRARLEHERLLAAEQAARTEAEATRSRFVDLVDGLDAIVWEADATTFEFKFVSQRAEQILGYPVRRWLEEPRFWSEHIHPEDRTWAVQLCLDCTARNEDHEFEYRMIAADGRVLWLRDLVHVVADEAGRPRLLRGVMVDVTKRKEAEQVREAFVGVLSHELRTPVTTILGAAELLVRSGAERDPATQQDLVNDIAEEARRLGRLVEDLLVLSRSEREQLVVEPEPVLVQHAIRAIAAAEGQRFPNVTFVTDVGALPPVAADRTYVDQILRNLLSNAAKYGPAGPAEVRIVGEHNGPDIEVRVLDCGSGFPPDERDRLFDLFYRASTSRRQSGAGIGLYVTRALVEAMGGRVWAERRPEGGSEFGFSLPVMAGPEKSARRSRTAAVRFGSSDGAWLE